MGKAVIKFFVMRHEKKNLYLQWDQLLCEIHTQILFYFHRLLKKTSSILVQAYQVRVEGYVFFWVLGKLCVYAYIYICIHTHIRFSKTAFWELLPTANCYISFTKRNF